MYAKLCNIEVLPTYVKEVAVGDNLTVQALITNALDWHYFYEKVSNIRIGDRTDFTVITLEGERITGFGNILEVDKWSNRGQYGFKIKINVKRQKSLSDRRTRDSAKEKLSSVQPENVLDAVAESTSALASSSRLLTARAPMSAKNTVAVVTADDINSFQEMLKESLAMDITS
ncbi:MAG: hypothetical protein M3115_05130 [Thermoproteota archaeon]|nr:hypothetical protein [Thermoproteota archaeon]